jgi:predicted PurR-regulated permease PerM
MDMNEISKPEPNPKTQADHKRETFWQITLPLIIGLVLVVVLGALTVIAATGGGRITQAGNAALIILIVPLMLITLIFTVIFAGIAFGIIQLNKILPIYTRQAQDAFARIRQQVQMGSDKAVEPILKIQSFFASFGAFKRK